ncbi:MAG: hypothetical protein ACXVEF_32710 [Polyangiales bacterium]
MRVLTLFALVCALAACKDYKPAPLDPSAMQSGKKHCTQPSDCGGASTCGPDGFCR